MLQVKTGDVDKLGLLYERYNKILFGFFYRLCGRQQTSEDLVQNVFFRILKYKDKFRNEGKFSTWMFHIAHNVNADHYRKNRRIDYTDDLTKLDKREDVKTEEDIIKNEQIGLLKKAMENLSSEQREVLVLSRFHDLKYREIGEILKCSEGAVKVRIFRALESLREIYSSMEGPHVQGS